LRKRKSEDIEDKSDFRIKIGGTSIFMRKTEFINNEYYHIYNRGVDKREVFSDSNDFLRFLKGMREFNSNLDKIKRDFVKRKSVSELSSGYPELSSEALVDIICYCLNPNHYHLVLKQLVDGGISKFMHKLNLGYTHYFNRKYDRSGSLFQGAFQAVYIDNDEYFLWVSAYVNINAQLHGIIEKAENYPWCSYPDFLGLRNGTLCNKKAVLDQFKDLDEYINFTKESFLTMKDKKMFEE